MVECMNTIFHCDLNMTCA